MENLSNFNVWQLHFSRQSNIINRTMDFTYSLCTKGLRHTHSPLASSKR